MAISDTIKRGPLRAPHRSLLRATGAIQSESDWDKPFIAVANSFVQIVPGHAHLDVVGRKVRAAIRAAGGVPFEFNTIGVDDAYELPIKYFLIGQAYSANTQRQDTTKASYFMGEFYKLVGMRAQGEPAYAPRTAQPRAT